MVAGKTLEFCFDYGSPTAYLAHTHLPGMCRELGARLVYTPVLLGGIFKATGNQSPVMIPAKGAYMTDDMARFSARYGVTLNMNPFFPINTLHLMRGAMAARQLGCFEPYHQAVFNAMWVQALNMADVAVVAQCLDAADLDSAAILAASQLPEVKQALIDNTRHAVERGAFGVPSMFVENTLFFGQDRMDFIAEALSA